MEPLDKLFTLFFVFSPIVIGIFTSFGLDVKLLWLPMGVLFFWALYIYQYRGVYKLSHNAELSLIERMRGLSFFFTFPILAIILAISNFGSNWVNIAHIVILGLGGGICSFIIDLSIPRTFFERQTALFNKSEKIKLSNVLTATANVTIYFSWATVLINGAILQSVTFVVIVTILLTPFGFIAYRFERKSRRVANDLAFSLKKNKWLQRFLYVDNKKRKRQTIRRSKKSKERVNQTH